MKDFLEHPSVAAIYESGSVLSGVADEFSDIDTCILTVGEVDLAWRREYIQSQHPTRYTIAPGHFGDGDAWANEYEVRDVMFWRLVDTISDLRRVVVDHEPKAGYTTAFWHTIRQWREVGSNPEYRAKLDELKDLAALEYSDDLTRSIVTYNSRLLRGVMFSLEEQIIKAAQRDDLVSLQHRTTSVLASWFDIVFAVNKQTHPGEKRLLGYLEELEKKPMGSDRLIRNLIVSYDKAPACSALIDALFEWLEAEGLSFV